MLAICHHPCPFACVWCSVCSASFSSDACPQLLGGKLSEWLKRPTTTILLRSYPVSHKTEHVLHPSLISLQEEEEDYGVISEDVQYNIIFLSLVSRVCSFRRAPWIQSVALTVHQHNGSNFFQLLRGKRKRRYQFKVDGERDRGREL